MGNQQYYPVWNDNIADILKLCKYALEGNSTICGNLPESELAKCGNRPASGYGFVLHCINGRFKRCGTAVGRDLAEVLDNNPEFRNLTKGKTFDIHYRQGQLYLTL